MSENRLLTEELKQLIEHETNYYAHEIVVPITGNPTTPYEINAVKKYKAEFTLFANKIIPLAFAAGEASQKEKDRQDTEYICTHKSFCCDKGENNECQAADDSVCDRRKPSKEQALKNKLIFKQAECDGLGSQLLEVQQDCIKAKQALAEARKEGASGLTSWFGAFFDSCLSYIPDPADRVKLVECWENFIITLTPIQPLIEEARKEEREKVEAEHKEKLDEAKEADGYYRGFNAGYEEANRQNKSGFKKVKSEGK